MSLRPYFTLMNVLAFALFVGLLAFGNLIIFSVVYFAVFIFSVMRVILIKEDVRVKFILIVAYVFVTALQLILCNQAVFKDGAMLFEKPFRRLFGIIMMLLPLLVNKYINIGKYARFYLPSIQEFATISFTHLKSGKTMIVSSINKLEKMGKTLSADNLRTIVGDLPRHDSFRYINNGSLTDEYFDEAEKHMNDPYVYIIISSTGSAASEMISVFTHKNYNHASLSFDRDLKTIISYNGGDRVYPPGLNPELLEFFNKKPDASIIVYKIACTFAQKRIILEKVREINTNGSAYNIVGLMFKYSHKPNIMFCSQFVYKMLRAAGLEYFKKDDGCVRPTDFIEQDYYRKLMFEYEIQLNSNNNKYAFGGRMDKGEKL